VRKGVIFNCSFTPFRIGSVICLTSFLVKLAASCAYEASMMPVVCLIQTGGCIILLRDFIHLLPFLTLGNHPPVLSPRSNRLTYHRTSLHPVPKLLVRPRGAPFAHEVHSGAVVRRPNPGQRDPLSRQYHHQAHHRGCHQECRRGCRLGCHRGCRPTERRPPGHGLLGKVDILNLIPPKTVTNSCEQCNLELSTRRRRPNPWFNWHPKRHRHNVASSAPARPALVDTSDTPFLMLTIL
jgi:hypothetical protein